MSALRAIGGPRKTRRRTGCGWAVTVFLACFAATDVWAAGLRDFGDGWLFSPRELAAFLGSSGQDPAFSVRPRPAGTWGAVGHTRLFGMADLTMDYLAAGVEVGGHPQSLQAYGAWQRTHGGLLKEDKVVLGLAGGRNPEVALLAEWWSATVMGQGIGSLRSGKGVAGWTADLGADWWGRQEVRLDLGDDGPGPEPRRTQTARTVLWGARGGLALAWDRSREGSFQVGLEVLVRGSERIGLLLRADPATGCVGPGLAIRQGSLLVMSSHVQHPDLGPTHRILLVAGDRPGGSW